MTMTDLISEWCNDCLNKPCCFPIIELPSFQKNSLNFVKFSLNLMFAIIKSTRLDILQGQALFKRVNQKLLFHFGKIYLYFLNTQTSWHRWNRENLCLLIYNHKSRMDNIFQYLVSVYGHFCDHLDMRTQNWQRAWKWWIWSQTQTNY